MPSSPAKKNSPESDLGKTWLLNGDKVFMQADIATKAAVAKDAAAHHLVWSRVSQLLKADTLTGGVIIEREKSTFIAGSFQTLGPKLIAAEGEIIEGVKPPFDYCFARM
jgi:hypothetical protein